MPKKVPIERQYLEMHGSSWRVTVIVPEAVRGIIGRSRLRHDLGTDSLRQANLTKKRHLERFRAQIAAAFAEVGDERRSIDREALELAAWKKSAKENPRTVTPDDWEAWHRCVSERAAAIRSEGAIWHQDLPFPEGEEELAEGWELIPAALERGDHFSRIANGFESPVDILHGQYLSEVGKRLKARTVADDARALKLLLRWLEAERIPASIERITSRRAHAFAQALPALADVEPATANKYLSRLSSYWQWLAKHVDAAAVNPWHGVAIKVARSKDSEKERPFTNGEVARLLSGPASAHMFDLMMLGALTGARLDAIVDLKVYDISADTIYIKAQKSEPHDRLVPIHPDLRDVLKRRCAGKGPWEDLFPEWPPVKKAESMRERSFKASNHFTDYRRKVGVDEVLPGKRRSLVNFHSFRRWFISHLRHAGVQEPMIKALAGHKDASITLSVYSDSELIESAAEAVGRIRVPGLNGEPIVEPRTLRVRQPVHQNPIAVRTEDRNT